MRENLVRTFARATLTQSLDFSGRVYNLEGFE